VNERHLFSPLVACCLLLSASVAWGQPPSSDASVAAKLTVTVVHAHKAKSGVDPKLKDLASYLKKSFAPYTGFAQVGAHEATVPVDGEKAFKLPDGKTLTLSFKGVAKGFIKVYLELDGLKTTVDVRDGGLFFQAGRVYKGGILVLAIGAKT
jgi:hypothetical protein